jgi:hypothetical protein
MWGPRWRRPLLRQTSPKIFNGVEVGPTGPKTLEFVLRRGASDGLAVELTAHEARAFADALRHWADVCEKGATTPRKSFADRWLANTDQARPSMDCETTALEDNAPGANAR